MSERQVIVHNTEIDDNTVITRVVKYIVVGIVVLIISIMGNCQMTKYRIVQVIALGTPPLVAECAITSDQLCRVLEAAEAEAIRNR